MSVEEKDMYERLNRSRVEIINKKDYKGYEVQGEYEEIEREKEKEKDRDERNR